MANAKDRAFDAFNLLGGEVAYAEANKWIKRKYGEGISDADFYNSRKLWREQRGGKESITVGASANGTRASNDIRKEEVSGDGEKTQTVAGEDFTMSEMLSE